MERISIRDDSAQSARAQHAIHGEPRRAAVAVAERVHFGYIAWCIA
jgi:hypothetical protein